MDKVTARKREISILPLVELLGVKRVVQQIGIERLVREIGAKPFLQCMSAHDIIQGLCRKRFELTPEDKEVLRRLLN